MVFKHIPEKFYCLYWSDTCGFVSQLLEHVLEVSVEIFEVVPLLLGQVLQWVVACDGAPVPTALPLHIVHIPQGGHHIPCIAPGAVLLGRGRPTRSIDLKSVIHGV